MVKWHSIQINNNLIDKFTDKACLIKMPKSSSYAGYKFWMPSSMVEYGLNKGASKLVFTDSWRFKLVKTSPRTFKVLGTMEIGAEEFMEEFSIVNDNISAPSKEFVPAIEVHEPKQLKPERVEVPECLKTN